MQQTLCKDLSPLNKVDSQGSRKPDRQEVTEISADDTIKCSSERLTKVAVESAENDRGLVGNSARNFTRSPVRGHNGSSTRGAQLQLQQNKSLSGDMQLQLQQDVNAMEVNVPEVPNLRTIKVVADPAHANKVDDLSDSDSDSEMRVGIAYLKKKREKAKLKAKLKHLECKMTAKFVDEQHQVDRDNHAHQLSLEYSKRI